MFIISPYLLFIPASISSVLNKFKSSLVMRTSIFTWLISLCLLLISTVVPAKDIRYVSDQLNIPMRSGTTTSHKILKFLDSGLPVSVLEVSDDETHLHVAMVDDETKTGWVEAALVMQEPSAREQLVAVNKKNKELRKQRTELKKQIAELKLKEAKLVEVQQMLVQLRKSAAKPILIAEENVALKKQIKEERSNNEQLVAENIFLSDKNIKQWFMIGAAVSIGSLLLGLLITRINWKKNDRWA